MSAPIFSEFFRAAATFAVACSLISCANTPSSGPQNDREIYSLVLSVAAEERNDAVRAPDLLPDRPYLVQEIVPADSFGQVDRSWLRSQYPNFSRSAFSDLYARRPPRDAAFLIELAPDFRMITDSAAKQLPESPSPIRRFYALSPIGYDRDQRKAILVVGSSCGSECGWGDFFFLAKGRDGWVIEKRVNMWKA